MIKEVIKQLKSRGYTVEPVRDKYAAFRDGNLFHDLDERDLYSARELIKFARTECAKDDAYKMVKKFTWKAKRRKTKHQIQAEQFEEITNTKIGAKNDLWKYD